MVVTNRHYKLLKLVKNKWEEGLALDKVIDSLNEEDIEYLTQLELAGLLDEVENTFELTQSGHLILEAIDECAANLREQAGEEVWSEDFKIIGSAVVTMLEVARYAHGDVSGQLEIEEQLSKRGLVKDGVLLPPAESILEAYEISEPKIFISVPLAEKLRNAPPGPGRKSLLPFTKEEVLQLESMRLLAFSAPFGNTYSLTGPGQQIRAGLLKGAAFDFALTDNELRSLLGPEKAVESKEKLMAIGAMEASGALLPAGVHLQQAAKLLYEGPITLNPAVEMEPWDFKVLNIVDELWEKHKENPEIVPSYTRIKEELALSCVKGCDHARSLYMLEGYGLIRSERTEAGVLVYRLTRLGRQVLADRKENDFGRVGAKAVMAITTTRMEHISPGDKWVEEAEEQSTVGKGYPTKSGRLFARIASSIDRMPLVDAMQRAVLHMISFKKGEFEQAILKKFKPEEQKAVQLALGQLVANGLLDLLPGGLYKITPPGDRFKRAMSVVPPGAKFHVTPYMLRVLEAALKNTEKNRIDWKAAERECMLDAELFNESLNMLRTFFYVKAEKVTTAGKLLLEGAELLKKVKVKWHEIEI